MKLLSWNCRGLGRPRTVRALRDAIRVYSPQIVCLMETKKKEADRDWIKWKLGFRNCLLVGCRVLSGGLALLWEDGADVRITSFSRNHIDAVVRVRGEFRLTLYYGEPAISNRVNGWNLLRRLNEVGGLPWIVIGDFNEVLCSSEVQGGRGRQNWQMENFRLALNDCNLTDLGFSGYPFTFSNRRGGDAEVRARLDRAVVNYGWRRMFPKAVVRHVQLHSSDHQLLVLDTDNSCMMRRKKLFRFEAMWLDHAEFPSMMEDFWNGTNRLNVSWSRKLKLCTEKLKSWNSSSFGNVQKRIKALKGELEEIRKEDRSQMNVEREKYVCEELDRWLAREEILWMQRSRALWMEQGDRNTKFFHARATHRKQKNWLSNLKDSQGVLQESEEKIMDIVTSYFSNIFQATVSREARGIDDELRDITPCISKEMNDMLLRDISEEEIKGAVFSLGPLKAPGIDGFPALFYQRFWEKIKSSVIQEVNVFWAEGRLDGNINRTLITLIPKKKDAERIEDWRPISLCTVAVKIITKILASRLQHILDQVISPFQSAFIKGRIITDNFIVAHELAHFMKNIRDDKRFYASLKVDMSKAYDRVEWDFLKKLLLRMGFAAKWVDRIMECVCSVTYRVKVNDKVSSVIKPRRGLRQGDPISPYLFLFCTELLSAKLRKAVEGNQLSGVQLCRNAPVVTHLLFADDSLFFIKAEAAEAGALKRILSQFEAVSGQRVNYEKSEICFSRNTPGNVRAGVCSVFGVVQVSSHSRYLGLPLMVGQRKTETCRSIVEKIWKRVNDWKSKLLSAAGREVLVKAVIQAMPVYMMSVYLFPKSVISEMARLIQQFWWNKKGSKGISWLSQDMLQTKKYEGGLGFKNLSVFNEAILMKVAWRMVKHPHLLISQVLLAKYCSNKGILDARLGSAPSHIWRGIMRGMHTFLDGIWWEEDGVTCRWKHSSTGIFTVKSAYEAIKIRNASRGVVRGEQSDSHKIGIFWKKVWSSRVPNKIKVFWWRLYHNSLPDALNLRRRGVPAERSCKLCGIRGEDALHVVRDCWWAKAIFNEMEVDPMLLSRGGAIPADWIWCCYKSCSEEVFRVVMVTAWVCWKNTNRVWHEEESWCVRKAGIIVKSLLKMPVLSGCLNPLLNVCLNGGWSPPGEGVIKINLDGSWLENSRKAGIGLVARDHLGSVLWAWAEQVGHCFCSGEVEGRALKRSMELAINANAYKVIFEIDSLEVLRAVSTGAGTGEWCFSWLSATLSLLCLHPGWTVQFVSRDSNQAADLLACKASLEQWVWNRVDAVPFCLAGSVSF
ncbi:unnamed protein product [Rhodiola kirilowii]